ncbi:MAG: DsbC family protein [Pseudomonadota bacterium]
MKKLNLAALIFMAMFGPAMAQELAIRKNISTRFPNFPTIDEVKKTNVKGIYEVRAGTEIYYSDSSANYFFRGEMLDTKTGINITRERIETLTAIQFSTLPLQDAIVWSHGDGSRKIAVFSDPNCSFCKKFEPELKQLKNVTVYTFAYPILSPDSEQKSRTIWCAKDRAKMWDEWMLKGTLPEVENAACDAASVERNLALGQRLRISGTPTIVFEDGRRSAGMLPVTELETKIQAAANSQRLARR